MGHMRQESGVRSMVVLLCQDSVDESATGGCKGVTSSITRPGEGVC